ncbi:MAG: hypothetical protein JWP27_2531 [Flaviaesturariibacter sp.]|nr:hypothetical protein [Flaviaesturariibacter sp.]
MGNRQSAIGYRISNIVNRKSQPPLLLDLSTIGSSATGHPGGQTPFGDARDFDAMPETHQAQISFLAAKATTYLHQLIETARIMTGPPWDPFAKGNFRSVDKHHGYSATGPLADDMRKWIYRRGLPFAAPVFVVPNFNEHAVMTTWKMVVKYAPDVFNHDDIAVFDHTFRWCLFGFHEGTLFFGKDPVYDPTEDEQAMQALNKRKQEFPMFRHPYGE